MKILFISPQIPFPLIDGAKRAIYYPIRGLARQGHDLTLLCLSERVDEESRRELSKYCSMEAFSHSKRRTVVGAVASMFRKTPYFLNRFHLREMLARAMYLVETGGYDLVHVETLHCAYYGLALKTQFNIPVVLRLHNIESMILSRFAAHQSNLVVKAYAALEARRVRRYESRVAPLFEMLFMISDEDEKVIQRLAPTARTSVYPAGVDLDHFVPDIASERENTVLWMGALQWPPNRDSFWWFVREIVPVIVSRRPSVRFRIVGSHPPEDILAFSHPNVEIAGFVPDVRTSIAEAAVAVVPLRIGGGIRLKLLELFAMGKAVVSTSTGCEGLGVKDGLHLRITDSPGKFADTVIELLDDRGQRSRLGEAARRHVEEKFSWSSVVQAYEREYAALASQGKRAS